MQAALQRAAHELWECQATQVTTEAETVKFAEPTQEGSDSPLEPSLHNFTGIDLTHRHVAPDVAAPVHTTEQPEDTATGEQAIAVASYGDTNRMSTRYSTPVHTAHMAGRVAACIRKHLAGSDHLVAAAEVRYQTLNEYA